MNIAEKLFSVLMGKVTKLSSGMEAINETITATTSDLSTLEDKVDTGLSAINDKVDNMIIESGTSDAETIASRTDSVSGKTYSTLGNRLDTQFGEIKEDLSDLDGRVKDLEEGGAGISDNAIDILDQLGSHIAFTSAQGGQLWNDLVDELRNSTPSATHTVTWTGSDYTASNTATSVKEGRPYTTTISPKVGYVVSAVTASMGNTAVIPTDNGDGTYTVSIASVDADISISVTTREDAGAVLFRRQNITLNGTTGQTVATGLVGGSTDANAYGDWTITCTAKSSSASRSDRRVFSANHHCLRFQDTAGEGVTSPVVCFGVGDNGAPTLVDYASIVITHVAGSADTVTLYYVKDGAVVSHEIVSGSNSWRITGSFWGEVYFGGAPDGTSLFVGEVVDFTILTALMDSEAISEYLTSAGGVA